MPILNCLTYASKGEGGAADDYSSWFGTGEDGDLTVSTDVALPVALDSGQIIKQYNNLTITSTGVLHPANRCNGMILLVKGDLTVDGTIHVDKCAPLLNDNEELATQEVHVALCGELTGGKGGNGGSGDSSGASSAKNGGIGGSGFRLGGGLGAGGGGIVGGTYTGAASYNGANGDPRPPIGTPVPFAASRSNSAQYGAGGSTFSRDGGGGPGGSGAAYYRRSGGDEYASAGAVGSAFGGGLLCIFVGGKVRINSTALVSSKGGAGANAVTTDGASSGPGGGAGGGIVAIVHTGDSIIAGAISASGGSAGSLGTNGGTDAQSGESGTVLITNIADLLGEGVWEPEWVTCSFTYSSMGKFQKLALMENENGVPVVKTYTVDTAPTSGTSVQVLKGSMVAIMPGPATMVIDATYLFGVLHSVEVYVANTDFSIGG